MRNGVWASACGLSSVLLVAACSNVSSPEDERVLVTVESASLEQGEESQWVQATFAYKITNIGEGTLRYQHCGTFIERYLDDGWNRVWYPFCSLSTENLVVIEPGETYKATLAVTAQPGQPPADGWAAPLDGLYRIKFGVFGQKSRLPDTSTASDPFELHTAVQP